MRTLMFFSFCALVGCAGIGCGGKSVDMGANVPAETPSPLFAAIATGDLATVQKELTANPALLNQPEGSKAWTPLHKAAAANQLEIAQYLLENGASVNAPDQFNQTPLVVANDSGANGKMLDLLRKFGGEE